MSSAQKFIIGVMTVILLLWSCNTDGIGSDSTTTTSSTTSSTSSTSTTSSTTTSSTTTSSTTTSSTTTSSTTTSSTTTSSTTTTTIVVSENNSGVMLQGFTWSSAPRDDSTQFGKWYNIVTARASDINNTFEYLWCPPPSESDDSSPEGYCPKRLNYLDNKYGTESEQKAMINAIKPTKAIADIVINHRAGTTCWGNFTDPDWGVVWAQNYQAICGDDEGFDSSTGDSHMNGVPENMRGAADTGEHYTFRDIDHTNTTVQDGIVSWMNNVLKAAGYVGWRYDYVKGYAPKYVGLYNKRTNAAFSVGEHWPDGYNSSNPSAWSKIFKDWCDGTETNGGQRSRIFDFTLKGALNTVFGYSDSNGSYSGTGRYALLADSSNMCISYPADAVTFVDNHDTGSTQGHWTLTQDAVGAAYAMILTHPGYPCVFWNHYFTFSESGSISVTQNGILSDDTFIGGTTVPGTTNTMRQHIDKLIALRKSLGIAYNSQRQTLQADSTCYAALVIGAQGSLIVSIGGNYAGDTTDYEEFYSGTNFKIWTNTTKCIAPIIKFNLENSTAEITCLTSGSNIYYTTNGSEPSSSSTKYTDSFSVTEGTTVKAIAAADGLANSAVVSKTYSGSMTLTATVEGWVWNDGAAIFAWVWGSSSTGEWIAAKGSGTTATIIVPKDTTGFNMARCVAGTNIPNWAAEGSCDGRVYNKTGDVTIQSGVTQYSTSWEEYNPGN